MAATDNPLGGQTPLGTTPTTGQLSVDQQRNQMLAQISAFLAIISGGGGATNGSIFAYTATPITVNTVLTLANAGVTVDASGGAITLTLPLAISVPGKMYFIKKIDASVNQVIIAASGADTIDGAAAWYIISSDFPVFIMSFGGTTWYAMSVS